jgi:hypothetical protein
VVLGTLSGIACFGFFWATFRLATLLAGALASGSGLPALPRQLAGQAEPVKWIGALLVVAVALLVTHAWDRLRVRYGLGVGQYWTMIGLALIVCLLTALLSGGF